MRKDWETAYLQNSRNGLKEGEEMANLQNIPVDSVVEAAYLPSDNP